MRTLVLGGVRSGKSAHGEALLAAFPRARYLATGRRPDGDEDWQRRIDGHRARRTAPPVGDRFTVAETTDVSGALRATGESLPTLVDDLGSWLTAVFDDAGAWEDDDFDPATQIGDLCAAIAEYPGALVLVSPETGLSVVPATAAGRRFQDALGTLNTAVADVCDDVVLVIAGRVLDLPRPARAAAPRMTPAADADARGDETGGPSAAATDSAEPSESSPSPASSERVQPDAPAPHTPVLTLTRDLDIDGAAQFPPIDPPDPTAMDAARARQTDLTKPPGALGRLEDLGNWITACQGVCPPRRISAPVAVVFAGDHGVARAGVSAFPPEVTAQMVANMQAGGAAINVLARRAGASVFVADMAVEADTAADISRYKVSRGTGDLRRGEAMSPGDARKAVAAGRACADELVDSGADLLIAGDMGIGNTTPAAVLVGTLTRREPVEVVGRGTGIDDDGWMRKAAAIRDGMRFGRIHRDDPIALLAAVAGPDLAAMAGFLAQAAVRRTPVLLDGMVVTSAALVAAELAPGAPAWWQAGHRSTEPAHGFALELLGLSPIVELSMRLGEGSGAMTALPIVADAVDVMIDMATFSSAGIATGD